MKNVLLLTIFLFLPFYNIMCSSATVSDSISIDVILEDNDSEEHVISITKNDLLTLHLEIDRSTIDISIEKDGGTMGNNSWSGISDTFDKKIAFTKDGKYRIVISNPGWLGGDAIHVTGSYNITDGLAANAEIILDYEPYDPISIVFGTVFIIGSTILVTIFVINRRREIKKEITQKYEAPNYDIALKVKESGYPTYKEYQEGQRKGAKSYSQYKAMKKYNVNSYELVRKILMGGFPNYDTYKKAKDEGIEKYSVWVEKEQQKEALMQLMSKTKSVHREDFMSVMGFATTHEFMDWFMNLPEDSPVSLVGDKVEFRVEGDDFKLQETFDGLMRRPKVTTEGKLPTRLDELADNQRKVIMDLHEGKALPHSQLVSSFKTSDLDVAIRLQGYIPENTFITRISDLYRLVKPSFTCQLCHQSSESTPFFQCDSCKRYLCQDHYLTVQQVGHLACPECRGNLISLPIKCQGCGVTYLDLTNMRDLKKCQFCNYKLEFPSVSHLNSNQASDTEDERPQKAIPKTMLFSPDKKS